MANPAARSGAGFLMARSSNRALHSQHCARRGRADASMCCAIWKWQLANTRSLATVVPPDLPQRRVTRYATNVGPSMHAPSALPAHPVPSGPLRRSRPSVHVSPTRKAPGGLSIPGPSRPRGSRPTRMGTSRETVVGSRGPVWVAGLVEEQRRAPNGHGRPAYRSSDPRRPPARSDGTTPGSLQSPLNDPSKRVHHTRIVMPLRLRLEDARRPLRAPWQVPERDYLLS